MKLVVGLGNPGNKYETTRHNAGFLAIDQMIEAWNAIGPAQKYDGEIYQTQKFSEKVLLVKPQTFMNLSGKCVGPLYHFYKCQPTDLIVIHDEVDLNPLTMKVKTGGGIAGHNGLRSVNEGVGSDHLGYHRIRIGVGKTGNTKDHVLQRFNDEEWNALGDLLDRVNSAAELLIQGNAKEAMNLYNQKEKK